MKKLILFFVILGMFSNFSLAQKEKAEEKSELDSAQLQLLKKLASLKFQTEGSVTIANGKANLKIPAGFKFLDAAQTHIVLEEYWGNVPQNNDGMLFLKEAEMLNSETWAFVVSFEDDGHVDDSDANKINYDEMLTQLKEETTEGSKERVKLGYEKIELIGWASQPYYDATKKTLHWAKELKFGDATENTLNYDVRILGRTGLVSMNAVGNMKQIDEIKGKIPEILAAVEFSQGNSYFDFNPSLDKVAAVGIGGLVAGKILAKAGLFAVFLKYIKVIFVAVAGVGTWLWKKITGKGNDTDSEN